MFFRDDRLLNLCGKLIKLASMLDGRKVEGITRKESQNKNVKDYCNNMKNYLFGIKFNSPSILLELISVQFKILIK